MLWLLLAAVTLILGRTYVWSITLWFYGRAGMYEPMEIPEPLIDALTAPVIKAAPPYPRPLVPARATHLRPAA